MLEKWSAKHNYLTVEHGFLYLEFSLIDKPGIKSEHFIVTVTDFLVWFVDDLAHVVNAFTVIKHKIGQDRFEYTI